MEDIGSIRLFLAVAEEEGFARAARRLGISAAAATRRIAALENALHTRLLARSTRRVSLTAEGEVYREHALGIVEAVEQSHEALRDFDGSPRGRLRVTARSSIGLRIIAPYLPEFRARYPQVSIGLELGDSALDIVAEGFDLAVTIGHLADSSLVARTLAVTDSLVCASPAYLKRRGRPTDPRELKDHECISFRARTGRNTWKFSKGSIRTNVGIVAALAVNHGEVLKQMALAGLGVVMVTDWLVQDELKDGSLERLFTDYVIEPRGTPITALYPSRSHLPQKVRVFLDFFAAKAAALLGPPHRA
jgi:DNA-binding transcriptional LysR family regulator